MTEQKPAQEPRSEQEPQRTHRNRHDPALAGTLANRLTRRDVSTGDIAELKRMNPGQPAAHFFWRLLLAYRITDPETQRNDDLAIEQAWAAALRSIAEGTKVGENETTGPHDQSVPMGQALALVGYSEPRLQALLNADETHIQRLADQAAKTLHQKGQKYNCDDLARLMFTPVRSKAQKEADRTYIARHYHRTLYNLNTASTTA